MNSSLPLRSMRAATVICAFFPIRSRSIVSLKGMGSGLPARPMRCSASVRAGASARAVSWTRMISTASGGRGLVACQVTLPPMSTKALGAAD